MIRLLPLGINTIDEVGYIMRVHPGHQLTDDVQSVGDGRVALFRIQRDFFRAHPDMVAYQWKWAASSALLQGKKRACSALFLEGVSRRSLGTNLRFAVANGGATSINTRGDAGYRPILIRDLDGDSWRPGMRSR